MNTLTLILSLSLAYLAGCIISYPRLYASFDELDQATIHLKPYAAKMAKYFCLLSWIGVIGGIAIYFLNNERTFWKWNNNTPTK
jgi:hypothetical protein